MSYRASIFVGCILFLGVLSIGLAISYAEFAHANWPAFSILLILAIPAQLYVAVHGRQSYYPHFICFFAGVLLLPLHLFALIIIIPHVVEWIREHLKGNDDFSDWYIQPFNIATHLIAGTACFGLVQLLQSSTTFAGILPPVVVLPISALIYVLLNHIIVGSVQVFVCDISFEQSRVMTIDSLLPDFILACLGILMALLWTIDPWWIGLALLPLILMYQALHVPQLKQEAETDSKTGLTNARYFTKRAKALVAETARTSTSMALIMADLDYLRTINNTYGHLVGDIVIKGIADIIRETIRDQDIAARFGGEEFIIALPGSDLISAVALGERIRQLIEKTEFTLSSGEVIQATMSMGVACFPHDGSTLTDVTHAADIAVYHAKLLGRNRIVCAPDVPLKAKLDYLAANIDDQKPPAPEQTTLSATSRAPIAIADRIK